MVAPTKTLLAPPSGIIYHDPGILRPRSDISHTGSVGNVDLRFQWDTDAAFGGNTNEVVSLEYENATAGSYTLDYDGTISGAIQWDDNAAAIKAVFEAMVNVHTVNVTGSGTVADPFLVEFQDPINAGRNITDVTVNSDSLVGDTVTLAIDTQGVTGPPIDVVVLNDSTSTYEQAPTSDLGLTGPWYWRVAVIDRDDGAGSWSTAQTLNYVDPIDYRRYLYLLENVGVAFHDTDEPAGGWGVGIGGTEGADGNIWEDFRRYLYHLANVGVGFDPTDKPGAGWGTGGTVGPDGLNIDFQRYLYLLENVDTTQPCPFLFSTSTPQAEAGDTVIISGQGLVSADDPTDAWNAEVRLYASASVAASFVVMSVVTWDAGETLDTITVTVPGGATSGFIAVVHTTTPTCTGSNFIGLTVISTPPDLNAGWWVEVWNLRNSVVEISPLVDVVSADFEHIPNDIGQGEIVLPANHPDLLDIIDRTASPPIQKLVKVYLHDRFAYSFIPDDSDETYSEDGAREVRIYGAGQESQLTWGRVLWNDYPAQPASARLWLWGSEDNLAEWGDMEPSTIITNGGIEDADPDPWAEVGNPALFADSAEAHSGIYSLRVTPAFLNDGTEITFTCQDGQQVYVDLWTKVLTIGGTYVVEVLDQDDAVLDTVTWVPGSAAWTIQNLDFVAATDVTGRLRITQTAGPLALFFVDDAAVFNTIDYGSLRSFRAVATLSRDQAADGQHSLKVAADAGGDVTFNGVEGFFTSVANQKYRFSVAVTGPVGDTVQFDVRLGGTLHTVQQVLTGIGTFDVMTIEATAGAVATAERFALRSNQSAALTFYADALSISPGEAAGNAGTIVTDVHVAMVARGTLDFVTLDFDGTLDSAGLPWPEDLRFEAQPEWSMWDLLEKLIGLGYQVQYAPQNWVEGGDTGWELQLFAPLNGGTDWSLIDDGPAILPGDTIFDVAPSAAPPQSTVVFGEAEGGLWSVASASVADITELERREDFVTNRSMKDSNTLFRALTHRLDVSQTKGASFTADLTDAGDPLPYFNMRPLDRIRAHLPQGKDERDVVPNDVYRVATIAARLDGGGRQQAYQADFGRYQLHKERIQALLFNRLLSRSTTENYQPGTGSVSQGGSTGSSSTSSSESGGGEVSAHVHGWPDVQPIDVGGDLLGTMPDPTVARIRGRSVSVTAPTDGQVYKWDNTNSEWIPVAGGGGTDLTTKGDLHGFDTGQARIPVGPDGQVLTADAAQALGVKWAAGGGGAGTLNTLDEVDTAPVSPDAMDDEFDDASFDAGLWSDVNIGGVTKTEAKHALVLAVNENVDQLRGIYQSVPAGDWTFRAKILQPSWDANFFQANMFVAVSTVGRTRSIGYWCDGVTGIRTLTRTSPTSGVAAWGTDVPEFGMPWAYVEIEYDDVAGDTFFRQSVSGLEGTFAEWGSITSGFTPTIVGLSMTNRQGAQRGAAFDWFRRIA